MSGRSAVSSGVVTGEEEDEDVPDVLAAERGKEGEHGKEDAEMKAMTKADTAGAHQSGRAS